MIHSEHSQPLFSSKEIPLTEVEPQWIRVFGVHQPGSCFI